MWRKNPDRETRKQGLERRVRALEVHIQDTEARYAELENRVNLAIAHIDFMLPEPEEDGV